VDERPRYLLGKGERLTTPIYPARGGGPKAHIYSFSGQQDRLAERLQRVAADVEGLPALACPDDRAVIALTLHPTYLAKSYFPKALLGKARLRPVGSRPKRVIPEKGNEGPSTELFVAGKRGDIANLSAVLRGLSSDDEDILTIEDVRVPNPEERLRSLDFAPAEGVFEVILHAPLEWDSVLTGFDEYLASLDVQPDQARRRFLRDLSVMPVRARRDQLPRIATFAFMRVARPMPRLREIPSARDDVESPTHISYLLPLDAPVDAKVRVAVFDGGIDSASPLIRWVKPRDVNPIGPPVNDFLAHGSDVTSALLFGPIESGELPRPFIQVDHYRVLDAASLDPNGEYLDVLDRIHGIMTQHRYDYVNLSLGPQIPIEDDEVHPWTALLDELLSRGTTLLTSAAGNDGEADRAAGLARIQPPADGVNILSIGSSVERDGTLYRAEYSCFGPGRSPGLTKPDVLAFGGANDRPFFVVGANGQAKATYGTSFASPNALRLATGLRAHLGPSIEPLGARALLLHNARDGGDPAEFGWGVLPKAIDSIITCQSNVVHILYQGTLDARQHRRFPIPLPDGEIAGMITIEATLCVASETDPKDPFNYTRAGAMPTFRPHSDRFDEWTDEKTGELRRSLLAKAQTFFKPEDRLPESVRRDYRLWETVLRSSQIFRPSSLKDPVFDIHYNPREGGADATEPGSVPYALVVTVSTPKTLDLYDRIVARYRTQLEPLNPVIDVQIRTRGS
jgi:hypothetical protein